jgi:hypothetical protein
MLLGFRGHPSPFFSNSGRYRIVMRTYYFDVKDGVPTRDGKGLEFPNAVGAIEHSKKLAHLLRHEPRLKDRLLSIVVVDESGTEIHREPVYPDEADHGTPLH